MMMMEEKRKKVVMMKQRRSRVKNLLERKGEGGSTSQDLLKNQESVQPVGF